tara:strand:+ start:607 stop:912 length:306 start_codon:yes stop_codon:yes gene_type:complete
VVRAFKKFPFSLLFLMSFPFLLSACSEGGELTLKDPLRLFRKAAPGSEFVAASSQYESSLTRNYKVQQTVGTFNSKMKQTSSPRGYKLYYSVQGAMLSEEM